MRTFNIIVAMDKNNAIGKQGTLPWRIPEDMKLFKEITTKSYNEGSQNVVIMGRNTWFSIPEKFRPLENRINIVVTSNKIELVHTSPSLQDALQLAYSLTNGEVFVIGGSRLYEEAMSRNDCNTIYVTYIDHEFEGCDTYFPNIDSNYVLFNCRIVKTNKYLLEFREYAPLYR